MAGKKQAGKKKTFEEVVDEQIDQISEETGVPRDELTQDMPRGPVLGEFADGNLGEDATDQYGYTNTDGELLHLCLPAQLPKGDIVAHAQQIYLNHLTGRQRRGLRRLVVALDGNGAPASLENGRYVQTNADAIRWMLEQITVGIEGRCDGTA